MDACTTNSPLRSMLVVHCHCFRLLMHHPTIATTCRRLFPLALHGCYNVHSWPDVSLDTPSSCYQIQHLRYCFSCWVCIATLLTSTGQDLDRYKNPSTTVTKANSTQAVCWSGSSLCRQKWSCYVWYNTKILTLQSPCCHQAPSASHIPSG